MPHFIQVKSILNKTRKRDSWFLDDYTINPYSGCSFNCLYCYIRGSKYGIHMEEKLAVKENALEVLEKQLATKAKKNQQGIIVLASATEPYLQIEKELELTRKILQLILKYRFPVHVITKSDLVQRDFDILKEINQVAILPENLRDRLKHKVFITFSFSTVDEKIGKIFEPGATSPVVRLATLEAAVKENFLAGVSMMPLLPAITDTEEHLEIMFKAFKHVGARYVMPASLTLFGNGTADSRTLVLRAVQKYYPDKEVLYQQLFERYNIDFSYQNTLMKRIKNHMRTHHFPDKIINTLQG
jgi:DNA repair photolyase